MDTYRIRLSPDEREGLIANTRRGITHARTAIKSLALLQLDIGEHGPGESVESVAATTGMAKSTLIELKKKVLEGGIELALSRKKREVGPIPRVFDDKAEVALVALVASPAPIGHARWTLDLLADEVVSLNIINDKVSRTTIKNVLDKHHVKWYQTKTWKIPPKADAAFVANMEDVLTVYARPYDADYPVVCMDESNTQLIDEVIKSLPCRPGSPSLEDAEYIRNGVANIILAIEPLTGIGYTEITERRRKVEWANFIKSLVDDRYTHAKKIILVMDNLNTHGISSLYEAFPPDEAKRLADRLEIHFTPKHGSWLNMAEIELSALTRQCIDRRIPSMEMMRTEVTAWTEWRNSRGIPIIWTFTVEKAREKLKKLYPNINTASDIGSMPEQNEDTGKELNQKTVTNLSLSDEEIQKILLDNKKNIATATKAQAMNDDRPSQTSDTTNEDKKYESHGMNSSLSDAEVQECICNNNEADATDAKTPAMKGDESSVTSDIQVEDKPPESQETKSSLNDKELQENTHDNKETVAADAKIPPTQEDVSSKITKTSNYSERDRPQETTSKNTLFDLMYAFLRNSGKN
jgi:hypothetical protein